MKAFASPHRMSSALMGAAVAIALACVPACKPAAPAAAPPAKKPAAATGVKTNAPAAVTNSSEQFVSAFNDMLPPEKAKDPFFPNSTRRYKLVVPGPGPTNLVAHAEPALQLKGASPGRFCVINSSVLELGEERGVRVPNGRITVKVLEIGTDYAIVKVAGEAAPKKLMLESKKSFHENH
jgi:hypothetical protein